MGDHSLDMPDDRDLAAEVDPPADPPPDSGPSGRLTAWLRTVVPALWSALLVWLTSLGLPDGVTGPLAELGDIVVVPVALGAVYALLRWVEPKLPGWATVVLLGSARTPTYSAVPAGEAGRVAYEAYLYASNGLSLVTGERLPHWAELREEIRAAWSASASAARAA